MKSGYRNSNSLMEIESVYLNIPGNENFYPKETIYDYLRLSPNSIQVNIDPYPMLMPALSRNGEKYVKSAPNDTTADNLLKLPRE